MSRLLSPALLAGALLALAGPQAALAQASPSDFTSAARYDIFNRVTGTIAPDPDGVGGLHHAAVRNSYDVAGRLIKVETGELAAWQSEAVAPSAWTGFTVFRTVETVYDTMDRKVRATVREGAAGTVRSVTQYSYDPVGRPSCTAVRMNTADFASPPSSACTQGTGAADRIARNVYDAAGRLVQVREGVGTALDAAEATFAYTPNGKREYVIDGEGNRARLVYDGHDRQICWMFPSTTRPPAYNDANQATALTSAGSVSGTIVSGQCATGDYETYAYDPVGNRTSLRKRDTQTIGYSYDALNRLLVKDIPGGTAADVYYGYNARGQQTYARFASTSGQGITNAWNPFGELTSSSTDMGGTTRTLAYQYDPNGNRVRITHPDLLYFTTDYDGADRPLYIRQNGTTAMHYYGYYAHGGVAGTSRANGTTTQWGYDGVQRLSAVLHGLAGTANDVSFYYTYNPASQMSSVWRDNDSYAWGRHYAVQRAFTTDGLNRYTQAVSALGTATYGYDANGNMTSDGSSTYTYDVENRLVTRSGGVALTYDPVGRLFQVTSPTTATTFLYDGDALVAEYNAAGNMARRYVHNVGADVPLLSYDGATLGLPYYLHADHQGSIVATSDPWGVGAINSYDEYGIPAVANTGRFQYTGQIWIPEIAMYHYKARVYSPTLGRFLQTDPIGYDDQYNLYAYVGNDPVNGTDSTGEEEDDEDEEEQEVVVVGDRIRGRGRGGSGAGLGRFLGAIIRYSPPGRAASLLYSLLSSESLACPKLNGPSCVAAASEDVDDTIVGIANAGSVTRQTNRTLDIQKGGGMPAAETDFELILRSAQERGTAIQTTYGPGRAANLPGGGTVTLRPGSSGGHITVQVSNRPGLPPHTVIRY